MFTGVKVFSATKAKERDDLGEQVTRWLRANGDLEIVDRTVIQSSDNEFHCLTVVLFYKPRNGAKNGPPVFLTSGNGCPPHGVAADGASG